MKRYSKFLMMILCAGVLGLFFVKGPSGKPFFDFASLGKNILSMKSAIQGWGNSVSGAVSELSEGKVELAEPTNAYRWQDEEGDWHYSDKPPAGIESEAIAVKTNINVVQSTPLPVPDEAESTEQSPQIGVPLPLTIAPGEVDQLIKDAKQVQELMNERSKTLESY